MSTVYGIDVSHYQSRLDLDAANLCDQGYRFVAVKATEGARFRDPAYHRFRKQAQAEGMLFAAYHFLSHGDVAAQVRNVCGFISDKSIPIMLDLEGNGATLADARQFRALAAAQGRRVTLLYLPSWYWQRLGSPSLAGWRVVSSRYRSSAHAYGSALYTGPKGNGWDRYGGVKPTLWQFASTGRVTGYGGNVDLDAFNGTLDELKRAGLFKNYGTDPAPHPKRKAKRARKPTRVDNARHVLGHAVDILTRSVESGRTGDVRTARDRIRHTINQTLPKH